MKDDLLNLNATVATVLDIGTWLWIASALILAGFAVFAAVAIGYHVAASFARAIDLVNDIQQPREEESL